MKKNKSNTITATQALHFVDIALSETFPNKTVVEKQDISNKFSAQDKIGYRIRFKNSSPVFLKIIFDFDTASAKRRKKFAKDFTVMQTLENNTYIPTPKTFAYRHHKKYDYYFAEYLDSVVPFIDIAKKLSTRDANKLIKNMAASLARFHDISLKTINIKKALKTQYGNKTPKEIWNQRKKDLIQTATQAAQEIGDRYLPRKTISATTRLSKTDKKIFLLHNDYIRNILIKNKKLEAIIDFEEVIPGDIHLELARAKWWFEELGLNNQWTLFLKAYSRKKAIRYQATEDYYLLFLLEYFQYSKDVGDAKFLLNTQKKLKNLGLIK